MVLKQRARREEDKQQRREAITKAARALLERSPRLDTTIAEVAERAGVAKGTVFLYFATREALELAVLEGELEAWFDAVDAELDQSGKWTVQRVTSTLVSTVLLRKLMIRLLGRLHSTLEHNADDAVIAAFEKRLAARTIATGARLEALLPFVAKGGGVKALFYMRSLLTGLWAMAEAAPAVQRALAEPDMAPMRVEFEREFEHSLSALLKGLAAE
jgi:AcrR family transcriptional regulator